MLKKLTIAIMLIAITFTAAVADTEVPENVEIILNPGNLAITQTGNFVFPDTSISAIIAGTGGELTVAPTAVPSFTLLDARGLTGDGSGWHVDFNCAPMTNEHNASYTVDLSYVAATSTLTATSGQAIDGTYGPSIEAISEDNLNADTMVVNCSQGYGKGTYDLAYSVANFNIKLDAATARAGLYSGDFTATIIAGPGGTGSWTGNVQ